MSKPALVALHRDVQVLGCDCAGCAGLSDSEYVAEPRTSLQASLPQEIETPGEHPDHIHIASFEVIEVRYTQGVPYAIHPCEVCGVTMEP